MKRFLTLAAVVCGALIGPGAVAASAHGADESNYRSTVTSIAPPTSAFTIRTIELGSRLELTVARGHTVVVNGYKGEPYLRVDDDGVFENFLSPAHWYNKDRYGREPIPDEADADLPPRWVRVGSGPSVRWHDHRVHLMVPGEPKLPTAAWTVALVLDGKATDVTGRLAWEQPPTAFPWLVLSAVAAVASLLAIRFRSGLRWWIVAAITVLAVYVIAVRVTTNHLPLVPTACIAIAVVSTIAVGYERRLTVVAAAAISYGAFNRIGVLHHSLVRFPGGWVVDRAFVTVALGLGLGALAAALLEPTVSRPRPAAQPRRSTS